MRWLASQIFGDSNQIFGMHIIEAAERVQQDGGVVMDAQQVATLPPSGSIPPPVSELVLLDSTRWVECSYSREIIT